MMTVRAPQLKCRECGQVTADPDEPCPTCLVALAERVYKDRIAEFFDNDRNGLYVRLHLAEASVWVTFVEHSVPSKDVRVGMRVVHPDREAAADRFRTLVLDALTARWHPVRIVMKDKRFVDPLDLGGL